MMTLLAATGKHATCQDDSARLPDERQEGWAHLLEQTSAGIIPRHGEKPERGGRWSWRRVCKASGQVAERDASPRGSAAEPGQTALHGYLRYKSALPSRRPGKG